MDADGYDRGCKRILGNLVGFLLVVFVCSLLIGIISSKNSGVFATSASLRNLRHVLPVESGRNYVSVNPDQINASKRRVPSGPDPFHNRHVGETKRPPGRV